MDIRVFNFSLLFFVFILGSGNSAINQVLSIKVSLESVFRLLYKTLMPVDIKRFRLTFHTFVIVIIPILIILTDKAIPFFITVEWQFRLANDGSFNLRKLISLFNYFLWLAIVDHPVYISQVRVSRNNRFADLLGLVVPVIFRATLAL